MNRQDFRNEIASLDVFDTHTHLVGSALAAKDFWDIGHYFWFIEELWAAGYPRNAEELPEDERIDLYVKAFAATRNTSMHWVVVQIFKNLYGLEITDAESIRAADAAVRKTSVDPGWPAKVAGAASIKRIVVNIEDEADFQGLPDTCVLVPRIEGPIDEWLNAIVVSADQRATSQEVIGKIDALLSGFRDRGCPGVMFTVERMALCTFGAPDELKPDGNSRDEVLVFLLKRIAVAAEAHGLFIQMFLGVEGGWNKVGFASANDPDRILKLHGLFESANCDFELVLGSDINQLDAVQAVRAFGNVHIGGQWWFNFRESTYVDSMQKCFEALPPARRSLVVSDGRCIEWCYGKILLIKRLLADFLFDRIQLGWTDKEEALRVAREWLYTSASARYAGKK